ncbi:hypothetical protein BDY24DRAFT_415913 [Mrakia frigida]|uniref:uncharacterized protein n=1 Tax=Mrakia frigida TaxID=29902 RepID=UPI003FCBF43C
MSGDVPFTEYPDMKPTSVFPRPGMQALAAVLFFLSCSILSYITARRSVTLDPFSITSWRAYSWPRIVCLLVFTSSWGFLFSSGILVLGVGMSASESSCSAGIFLCVFFYATSKMFIYLFLIEKVYVVSCTTLPRFQSTTYLTCLLGVVMYAAILVLMIIGRIAYIAENGSCHIGLKPFASIPLLSYDLFLNVFLTSLFVVPILRQKFTNPKIRGVAVRAMIAALVALTTSSVNIAILTLMHGKQLGFVCLSSCGADVTINALVLFYATWAPGSSRSLPSFVRKGSRHLGDHDNVGNQNEAREYCNFPDPSTGVYFNGSPQDDSTSRFPGVRTTLERFDSISGDGNHNAMNSISVSVVQDKNLDPSCLHTFAYSAPPEDEEAGEDKKEASPGKNFDS